MSTKALTKALHTVRVVERVAAMILPTVPYKGIVSEQAAVWLFSDVLRALDNAMPDDPALRAACLKACERALSVQS